MPRIKQSIRTSIRKYFIFLTPVVSLLFIFPPFLVAETPVERLAMPDFPKAA
jgi:hypothetical protein